MADHAACDRVALVRLPVLRGPASFGVSAMNHRATAKEASPSSFYPVGYLYIYIYRYIFILIYRLFCLRVLFSLSPPSLGAYQFRNVALLCLAKALAVLSSKKNIYIYIYICVYICPPRLFVCLFIRNGPEPRSTAGTAHMSVHRLTVTTIEGTLRT